jgi:hypothetical protein
MSEPATIDATNTADERLQTRYSETELICQKCQARWSPVVAMFINFETDPKGREGILRKSIHHAYCPACKFHVEIDHIFSTYLPDENLVVQVRPKWEFKAGGGEEMYWKRLEQLIGDWADVDVKVDVVFGLDEMIEKYLGGQAEAEAALTRASSEREQGLESGTLLGWQPKPSDNEESVERA